MASRKHRLGVVEGERDNSGTMQALLDNLTDRSFDPEVCRLFIVDGAKALTKAIRRTFGAVSRASPGLARLRGLPNHDHNGAAQTRFDHLSGEP